MTNPVQSLVIQHLSELGWSKHRPEAATRDYNTAVGIKVAIAYCHPSSREPLVILSGDYQSEGRNALSTCSELIPAAADQSTVLAAVERFNARANAAIEDTYAMRLNRASA